MIFIIWCRPGIRQLCPTSAEAQNLSLDSASAVGIPKGVVQRGGFFLIIRYECDLF